MGNIRNVNLQRIKEITRHIMQVEDNIAKILAVLARLHLSELLDHDEKLDHVLTQAYFSTLGRSIGYQTACNRLVKGGQWDVVWRKDHHYVRVEVEPLHQGKVLEDFNKMSASADEVPLMSMAILVLDEVPLGKVDDEIGDYLYDVVLNPKRMLRARVLPRKSSFTLLSVNIRSRTYQVDQVGPEGRRKVVPTRTISSGRSG